MSNEKKISAIKAITPKKSALTSRQSEGYSRPSTGYKSSSTGSRPPRSGFKPKGNGGRPNFRKPAPRRPLSPRELKALEDKKLRRERLDLTYNELKALYPNAFDRVHPKPLAVDVHKELFQHVTEEGPLRKSAIRQFLASYIRNDAYHAAALKYKKRFNLQGEAVQDLDESELEYHRQSLRPAKPARKPSFGRKPGFNKKPGFGPKRFGGRPNDRRGRPHPNFNVGQKVIAGGNKEGTVKEVIGDKVRVTLDNGITLLFNIAQVKKI